MVGGGATANKRKTVPDHQKKEEANRARVPPLYSYINSSTTGGGASVQANSRDAPRGECQRGGNKERQ